MKKSKEKIIFSVIIPAYNEEKLLPSCLKSVLNQDFPKNKYEVIVVNNASTDKTPQIAKAYGVKVINEPKKGFVFARSAGLKEAKGKYIVNLDADCTVPKNWLKKINLVFQKNSKTALVTGPCITVYSNHKHSRLDYFNATILDLCQRIFKVCLCYYGGNVAIKKPLLLRIGAYDLRFPMADQISLLKRIKKAGGKNVLDKDLVVLHSGRRTEKRMLKFLFQEVLFLYFFNNLYTKITGKSLGSWEDIR